MTGTTASPAEIARFDALAARWWDPDGPMRPLHRMNPVRVAWIAKRIEGRGKAKAENKTRNKTENRGQAKAEHKTGNRTENKTPPPPPPQGEGGSYSYPFSYSCPLSTLPSAPLRILDIGCGAGLAAEALARRGFDVLGLDAAGAAIEAARAHANGQNLQLAYRAGVAEDLKAESAHFPIITALEVIEHVPNPAAFLATLAALLEPGGLVFLSTLNRTRRSFLAAKVGAEYLLRWLPVGTHDWRRFITPVELAALLRDAGMRVTDIAGLAPDPLTGRWHAVSDTAVNYIIAATA